LGSTESSLSAIGLVCIKDGFCIIGFFVEQLNSTDKKVIKQTNVFICIVLYFIFFILQLDKND
jgi:hypothetical protein